MNSDSVLSPFVHSVINSKYSRARYMDMELIINSDTGYVNGSRMCSENDRLLADWIRKQEVQDRILAVKQHVQIQG